MKKYLIIIEKTDSEFSSYSPDLPGCIATGETKTEVEKNMSNAIQFHLDGLKKDGSNIPEPISYSKYLGITV